MLRIVELSLSKLFPPEKMTLSLAAKESFLNYAVSNHSEHDPLRPLGYFDSWAGKPQEKRDPIGASYEPYECKKHS